MELKDLKSILHNLVDRYCQSDLKSKQSVKDQIERDTEKHPNEVYQYVMKTLFAGNSVYLTSMDISLISNIQKMFS